MSFGHLKLPEGLRPWHTAGLRYLFPDSTADTAENSPTVAAVNAPDLSPNPELPADILQQLHAKVCVPSYSVWTYWELGEDFLQTPSMERRSCLAALMRSLAWPKGSITFWPVAVPIEGSVQTFVPLFWQTVATIQAPLVAVFGSKAFSALVPQKTRELFHCEGASPMLVALPDLAELSADKVLYDQTYVTLQKFKPGSC